MGAPDNILVMGANGRLGAALVRCYQARGLAVRPLYRADLDLTRPEEAVAALAGRDFNVLVNAAGNTDVDYCEGDPALAQMVNAACPGAVAGHCAARGALFVHISSDYVFAGDVREPHHEDDPTLPVNHYGQSKLDGERAVRAACPDALVARVSWLFGLEKPSFPDRIIRNALELEDVSAVNDKWACPTYADDVAGWLLALMAQPQRGIVHLCNEGASTWQEYGQAALDIAASLGLPLRARTVRGHSMHGFAPFKATRPPYTPLSTERFARWTGQTPRHWRAALEEYLRLKYGQPAQA